MSDILIKGVEMPISCANCPLRCYDRDDQKFCGATGNAIRYELSRPENCPLIEVQEPKTGKWEIEICDDGYGAYNVYKCDQCGDLSAQPRNYCRECGARMVSE